MRQTLTPFQLEAYTVDLGHYRRKCRYIPYNRIYSETGSPLYILSNNMFTADAMYDDSKEVRNFPMHTLRIFMPSWGAAC
jgi:hypothetical protein